MFQVSGLGIRSCGSGAGMIGVIHGPQAGNWGYMKFPKIWNTFLGVPRTRTTVFWGLYWGSPFLGKYGILVGRV